jgi:hypothetical protein
LAAALKDYSEESPLSRLVDVLPFSASISGNLQKTCELLEYVLNEKVSARTIYRKDPGNKQPLQNHPEQVLGTYSLNDGFIVDGYPDETERTHHFQVFIKDELKMPLFLPGECYGRLVDCFLSFFLPLGEPFKLIPTCDASFTLSPAEENKTRPVERKKLILEIDNHLGKESTDLSISLPLSIKVKLKKYFTPDKKEKTKTGVSYLAFNTEL